MPIYKERLRCNHSSFGSTEWKKTKVWEVARSSMNLCAWYSFYSCGQHFSYCPDDEYMKGQGPQRPCQHGSLQFYNRLLPSPITDPHPHIIPIYGSITSTNPHPGFCSCQLDYNLFPLCRECWVTGRTWAKFALSKRCLWWLDIFE